MPSFKVFEDSKEEGSAPEPKRARTEPQPFNLRTVSATITPTALLFPSGLSILRVDSLLQA
jgi:hypothetical protein